MPDWAKQIEEDLAWREAEMASLKAQIIGSRSGQIRTALLRASWALLYAHYEGFCKFAWDLYLDALKSAGWRRRDCQDQIARLSLHKAFRTFRGNLSPKDIWDFCQSGFRTLLDEPLTFATRLETKDNLWPDLFCKNCELTALPHTMADEYATELKVLVGRRNDIAHGQRLEIRNLQEYRKYEEVVQLIMHELAVGIVDSIEQEAYLKTPGG